MKAAAYAAGANAAADQARDENLDKAIQLLRRAVEKDSQWKRIFNNEELDSTQRYVLEKEMLGSLYSQLN